MPNPKSVANYGLKLLELYRQGARKETTINLPDRNAAVALRARLHSLRVAMRHEQHPMLPVAEQVTFTIRPATEGRGELEPSEAPEGDADSPLGPFLLVAAPVDSRFDSVLEAAGITTEGLDIPDEPFADLNLTDSSSDPMKDFLAKD